jgi:hypothetical protein
MQCNEYNFFAVLIPLSATEDGTIGAEGFYNAFIRSKADPSRSLYVVSVLYSLIL